MTGYSGSDCVCLPRVQAERGHQSQQQVCVMNADEAPLLLGDDLYSCVEHACNSMYCDKREDAGLALAYGEDTQEGRARWKLFWINNRSASFLSCWNGSPPPSNPVGKTNLTNN